MSSSMTGFFVGGFTALLLNGALTPADELSFRTADRNSDKRVTSDELDSVVPENERTRRLRDLKVVDWDRSGDLSEMEFHCLPGVAAKGATKVPDPYSEHAERLLARGTTVWSESDKDGDGMLTEEEFKRLPTEVVGTDLKAISFSKWDLDENGRVTADEFQRAVKVAYGIVRLDGMELRRSSGHVFRLNQFRWLDENEDGFVEAVELAKRHRVSLEEAGKTVSTLDTDEDEKLAREETWKLSGFDTVAAFCRTDQNLDGEISATELARSLKPYEQDLAFFVSRAFDSNKSKGMDFSEYRQSPLANGDVAWRDVMSDLDGDGRLSLNEFHHSSKLDATAIVASVFSTLDTSDDGFLDCTEFFFDTNSWNVTKEFELADANHDNALTSEEVFGRFVRPSLRQHLERDIRLVDWDRNGELSREEFSCVSLFGSSNRIAVPDPFAALAASTRQSIDNDWSSWGSDQAGLSSSEFDAASLKTLVPGLSSTGFKDWDLDGDGRLTRREVDQAVNAAYGLVHMDGTTLRRSDGFVFRLMIFWWFDKNDDGFLTATELEEKQKLSSEEAQKKVTESDSNGDGRLSMTESWAINQFDTLSFFRRLDSDLNGTLSSDELVGGIHELGKEMASFVVPAFDIDGSGELDFHEYRLSPVANFDELYRDRRQDKDRDGLLSLAEFDRGRRFDSVAVTAIIFGKLDLSGDGLLDLTEYNYSTPVRNPQAEFHAADNDGDEQLSLEELLRTKNEQQKEVARRDFELVDWDRSGALSLSEFKTFPDVANRRLRTDVPDPMADRAQALKKNVDSNWAQWTGTTDGHLDSGSFDAAGVRTLVPGLSATGLNDWDLDGDSLLSREEVDRVIDAAFGLIHLDGTTLRRPNGVVFRLMIFWWLDKDDDGHLTSTELRVQLKLDDKEARKRVADSDSNGDGRLSMAEAWETNHFDTLSHFRKLDSDLNGALSPKELLDGAYKLDREMASFMIPAFDEDGDGELSFREFRLSPVANFDELYRDRRRDTDNDGLLSLAEFDRGRKFDSVGVTAIIFGKLDLSGDGMLDLTEYAYLTSVRNVEREFAVADLNDDSELVLSEFVRKGKNSNRDVRDFGVFDLDANDRISFTEYQMVPTRVPVDLRVCIGDPIRELSETMKAKVSAKFIDADQDGNDLLDQREFRVARLGRLIPGLELTGFSEWDTDGNRAVSGVECAKLVDIAYGCEATSGESFRMPSGVTCRVLQFRWADKNHDGRLSRSEYYDRADGSDRASEHFTLGDTDQNGRISLLEWTESRRWCVDPLSEFLNYDTDFDSYVSQEELANRAPKWQAHVINRYIPAFDDDKDGRLSLSEYRLTPTSNPVGPWERQNEDVDKDGRLSSTEFYSVNSLEGVALAREYFDRFDADKDGYLQLSEWDFRIDVFAAPIDVVFEYCDVNGDAHLDLDEMLVGFKGRTEPWLRKRLGTIEEKFLDCDVDGDGTLTREEYEDGRHGAGKGGNNLSTTVSRSEKKAGSRFWAIVVFNALLIVGVGWYVLFKS